MDFDLNTSSPSTLVAAAKYIACSGPRWEQEFAPFETEFGSIPMILEQKAANCVAYLGHDVNDAAVRRRAEMLAGQGLQVRLGGFHRSGPMSGSPDGVLDLGRTQDSRLARRALSVLKLLLSPGRLRGFSAGARVLIARNLEMLAIAARVHRPGQRLVYECLDIHRLMLGSGWKSRLMRWGERRLLARTDLVLVSSPAFAREYFDQRQGRSGGVLLIENKVPVEGRVVRPRRGEEPGTKRPVTIGWFGMLRCRRTLAQLAAIAAQAPGTIEVIIAGIPSPAEFPDFPRQVSECPGLQYLGSYRARDLAGLYGRVDYVWAIDYFEEGLNSDWLLPNRLYEGLAHGVVPIALRTVETGRWLGRHGVGLLVDDPVAELVPSLARLAPPQRADMLAAIEMLPPEVLYQTACERRKIAAAITGLAHV